MRFKACFLQRRRVFRLILISIRLEVCSARGEVSSPHNMTVHRMGPQAAPQHGALRCYWNVSAFFFPFNLSLHLWSVWRRRRFSLLEVWLKPNAGKVEGASFGFHQDNHAKSVWAWSLLSSDELDTECCITSFFVTLFSFSMFNYQTEVRQSPNIREKRNRHHWGPTMRSISSMRLRHFPGFVIWFMQ